jgi:hypothetical protein
MEILLCIEVNIDTGVGYAFRLESNQYRASWVVCSIHVNLFVYIKEKKHLHRTFTFLHRIFL